MKILITGGTGFIGSHVVDAFVDNGDDVTVVDHEKNAELRNENPTARYMIADMIAPEVLSWIEKEKPDVICHLAAQISVPISMRDPDFDYQENVEKPKKLAEIAAENGVSVFISTSSCAVYGDSEDVPLGESHEKHPLSPYGKNKLAFEPILTKIGQESGMRTISLRPANVYGPRQTAIGEAGVIAIFMDRFLQNEDVTIFGDGNATRDFVYVEDIARAFLLAAKGSVNGVYNLGTGIETSVNELWGCISELNTEKKSKAIHADPREGDIDRSCLNSDAAEHNFGWKSQTDLQKGLKETYDWFTSKL